MSQEQITEDGPIRGGRVEPVVAHTFLDEVVRSEYRRVYERKYGD